VPSHQAHIGENIGRTPTHGIIIELKPDTAQHATCAR
jgi:hypothetical protein